MLRKVGKIMLLVTGIIFIVIGVWGLVSSAVGLAHAVKDLPSNHDDGMVQLVGAIVALTCALLLFVFYFFAGLRGVKTCLKGDHKNVTKAFIWAILILIFNIAPVFVAGIATLNLASNYTGIIVDVVYVVGAFFVKLSK